MRVSKFDAWGNDFLVLDLAEVDAYRSAAAPVTDTPDWAAVARAWCDRSSGVGADGLLLLQRIDDVNARMKL